ncbi:MAG TPA: HAD family hydrolase [Candidatus Bathyarchaeota archaeon]|nr:HAD family hydrolase [Candidatus Bathyarchaeota archaeon]
MRIKAVLFDLFDTLVIIEGGGAHYAPSLRKLHEFLRENGVNVPFEDFHKIYFQVRDKFYSESRESLEEPHFNLRISQTLQKLGYNFNAEDPVIKGATQAFSEKFMEYISLDPDAPQVLEKLRGKYKLGLISNLAIPECAWKLLEKFNLKNFFNTIIISGEINRRKPSAEIFQKALKNLGVKASEALFVGDMPDLDIAGPKKVGMKAILIQRRPANNKMEIKPDKTIKRLTELLPILKDC